MYFVDRKQLWVNYLQINGDFNNNWKQFFPLIADFQSSDCL